MRRILTILSIFVLPVCVGAAKWYPAQVEMSDGVVYKGKLSPMGKRPLVILPDGSKYQRKILMRDILSITQITETRQMNRPWAYKESGRTEKVYFEGSYPFMNFATEVMLTNGDVIKGHIISLPCRFKGKGLRKVFISRQLKGKVGETLDDVNYPVRIFFSDNNKQKIAPIAGEVRGYGKLEKVTALDNCRGVVCFAEIKGNKFTFNNLLSGSYDIFILTDSHVLCGVSAAGPDSAKGAALPENSLKELNKVFPKADDFFKKRWILALNGNTAFAKTLVYKRREKYYKSDKHSPGGYIWHLDVWSWHLAGSEWKIDRRYIMIRHKQKGGEQMRKLLQDNKLAAVVPGTQIEINSNKGASNATKFIRNLD